MLKRWSLRLRALLRGPATDRDLDDEMRFHLEQQEALYRRAGDSPAEARRKARVAFGSRDDVAEQHRDQRGTRSLFDVIGNVRYAARTLWRDRALALAGVVTLALGIGATTAVFSAVNAVMLRDLPYAEPDRLVQLWEENPDRGWHKNVVAPANFLDWREQASGFEDMAAYTDYEYASTLLGHGDPRLLNTAFTTGNFLSVLGVQPHLGRGFEPGDEWDRGHRPILISHRIWRSIFRSDSAVIGTSINLGFDRRWEIVGVMPEGFSLPTPDTDLWSPMLWNPNSRSFVSFRRAHWLRVVGRLAPGATVASANASLQGVVRRLQTEYPATNTRMGAGITPMHEWVVGDTRRPLLVLLSAAAVLLLIACANVGNLLLVHALSRSRDVSLRFALGATRGRVAGQALTESLVLSTLGGVAGFALGWLGSRALLALQPPGMLPVTEISLDVRVLLFAVAITTVSALAFGMAPALMATRAAPADALNSAGRSITGGRVRRWGRWLVAAEVALAVVLTIGAGLLLRSYDRLASVPPGFDPEGVLTASLNVPASRYDSAAKVVAFYGSLLERLAAIPGVERAAAVRQLPVTQSSWSSNFALQGRPPFDQGAEVVHREIMGEYFRVMGVPLLEGRAFSTTDRADATPVVLINDAMRRLYFAGESPVGQQITFDRVPDSTSFWRTIVGVVGNEHQGSLALPARPEIFAPLAQDFTRGMHVVLRASAGRDPATLAAPLRRTVRGLDSLLAVSAVRPMTDVHAAAMSRERFTSVLVLVFAITGVALALVGVFGVLAQLVQSRWREMGIRMALGAQRSSVRWMVAAQGARLMAGGIVAGILVSLGATRVLDSLLYDVHPTDLATYLAAAVGIGAAGMLAAWVPAWRASGANPATTLRAE